MHFKLFKYVRHFSGLTQQDMADFLGQTQAAVSRYEYGTLKPSPETLRQMKQIYQNNGVGLEELNFLTEVLLKKKQ